MYMAIIVEETVSGFHRETLWYGGDPENLASTILDVMNDWYEPNKKKLDKTIIKYHKMLEEKENLSFKKMEGKMCIRDRLWMEGNNWQSREKAYTNAS